MVDAACGRAGRPRSARAFAALWLRTWMLFWASPAAIQVASATGSTTVPSALVAGVRILAAFTEGIEDRPEATCGISRRRFWLTTFPASGHTDLGDAIGLLARPVTSASRRRPPSATCQYCVGLY